jgi:hypothetical protein
LDVEKLSDGNGVVTVSEVACIGEFVCEVLIFVEFNVIGLFVAAVVGITGSLISGNLDNGSIPMKATGGFTFVFDDDDDDDGADDFDDDDGADDFDDDDEEEDGDDIAVLSESDFTGAFVVDVDAVVGFVADDETEPAAPVFVVDDFEGVFLSLSITVSFAGTFVVAVVGIVVDVETVSLPADPTVGDIVVDDFVGIFKSLSITISANTLFLDNLSL